MMKRGEYQSTPLGLYLARVRRVGQVKSKLAVSSTLERCTPNLIHRRRRISIAHCAIPFSNVGSGELIIS